MTPESLLQDLIRIPSVNPENSPGTDQVGEATIASHLKGILSQIGFSVSLEEVKPGRPNLIARCPGPDSRPRILLGPHLDTVGVGGMTIDPFGGHMDDGKIWGRGASDTKGPMTSMICALASKIDLLEKLPIAVDFVAFMGEESHQWGAIDFAEKYAQDYLFAIAGEPTMLDIVYTTKGACWATLETTGKAAHASQPELGENAILKLTRTLDHLNRKLTGTLATYTHPALDHSTINIGTISGGNRPNIVPDHAQAEIDIRYTPDLQAKGGAIIALNDEIKNAKLPVAISDHKQNPPMEVPLDDPFLQILQQANPSSKPVGAPWYSDAAHLNNAGVPAVCIGPGSIDQAHTKDEFIHIDHLNDGVRYFENFIEQLNNL